MVSINWLPRHAPAESVGTEACSAGEEGAGGGASTHAWPSTQARLQGERTSATPVLCPDGHGRHGNAYHLDGFLKAPQDLAEHLATS